MTCYIRIEWEETVMPDGSFFYAEKRGETDTPQWPPKESPERGESEHCVFCERQIVTRYGGFCKNWDQMLSCKHVAEAEAIIMRF